MGKAYLVPLSRGQRFCSGLVESAVSDIAPVDGRHWIYPRDPGARVLNEITGAINNDFYTNQDASTQIEIAQSWFSSLNTTLSANNTNYSPPKGITHAFDLVDYYILDRFSSVLGFDRKRLTMFDKADRQQR